MRRKHTAPSDDIPSHGKADRGSINDMKALRSEVLIDRDSWYLVAFCRSAISEVEDAANQGENDQYAEEGGGEEAET